MAMLESFEWYTIIPGLKLLAHGGGSPGYPHVAHAIIVCVVLIIVSLMGYRRLAALGEGGIIPEGRFSLVNVLEMVYETIYGIMHESLGHHARQFVYLIGSLGLFILTSNLLGLIPGFVPPTDNVNTTAACALVTFFATHIYGIKTHGWGYVKQFTGPFWWLAWLMIPLEIISHLARPLSLTLRLFGNLMGDHMVYAIFVFMAVGLSKFLLHGPVATWIFAPLAFVIPIVPVILGVFVAIVQTFVFVLLSMTYISGALSEAH